MNKGLIRAGAIVHSDRGSQYASIAFRELLQRNSFRQLMSGKGNCYVNAQAESFFTRFKEELVENGVFGSVEEARSEVFSFIEGYYNRVRLHSSLGDKSPLEFEKIWTMKIGGKRVFYPEKLDHLIISSPKKSVRAVDSWKLSTRHLNGNSP